jgi:hypothetical protein
MGVVPADRSFLAFGAAIRATPGFWLRVIATASLALALAATKGVCTAAAALLIGLAVLVAIGYPLFRTRGRLP